MSRASYNQIVWAVYTVGFMLIAYFSLLNCTVHFFFFTIASADYTSESIDLLFGSSNKKRCVLISVLNDTIPEVPEHFRVVLSMTTPLAGVILTPDSATVVISDNDGEYSDS